MASIPGKKSSPGHNGYILWTTSTGLLTGFTTPFYLDLLDSQYKSSSGNRAEGEFSLEPIISLSLLQIWLPSLSQIANFALSQSVARSRKGTPTEKNAAQSAPL